MDLSVCEVECLLKQLEETNPTATESEQVAYVNIAAKPDIKQHAIAALKEGSETIRLLNLLVYIG